LIVSGQAGVEGCSILAVTWHGGKGAIPFFKLLNCRTFDD
jgi:hypothetical protein